MKSRRVREGLGGSWMAPECMEGPGRFWEGLQCFRRSSMDWEDLEGSKRLQEYLGGSRRVLACLEDLGVSVRVWLGPEEPYMSWRDHESLGGYG